jgi:hypothetical protein
MSDELAVAVDAARGDVPLNTWIVRACEAACASDEVRRTFVVPEAKADALVRGLASVPASSTVKRNVKPIPRTTKGKKP